MREGQERSLAARFLRPSRDVALSFDDTVLTDELLALLPSEVRREEIFLDRTADEGLTVAIRGKAHEHRIESHILAAFSSPAFNASVMSAYVAFLAPAELSQSPPLPSAVGAPARPWLPHTVDGTIWLVAGLTVVSTVLLIGARRLGRLLCGRPAQPHARRTRRRPARRRREGTMGAHSSGSSTSTTSIHSDAPGTPASMPAADAPVAAPAAEVADAPRSEPLAMMRWWSHQVALWAAAVYLTFGVGCLYAASTLDCFYTVGVSFGEGCLAFGILRLLMRAPSRVEKFLSRIGILKLHACNCAGCVALLLVLSANGQRTAPAEGLGFCPPDVYENSERTTLAVVNNFRVAVALKVMIGHMMAVEFYPLLDAEAICAEQGRPATLVGWYWLLAPVLPFDAVWVAIVFKVHPSPIGASAAGVFTWLISIVATMGYLRRQWRCVVSARYVSSADCAICAEEVAQPVHDDSTLCVICLEKPKTHLLFPCGHQCLCETCSEVSVGHPCPLCRTMCDAVCRVYA